MTKQDYAITGAMMALGGSFASLLGELARAGDEQNQARLKAAFPEMWAEYLELAMMRAERGQGPDLS